MRMPKTTVPLLAAFVVVLFAGLAVALLTGSALAGDQWLVVNPSDLRWTPCGDAPLWDVCGRVALRGDRAKEASDHFMQFPKGFAFPRHWHDHPENIVVISGSVVISHDDGGEDVISPGGYLRIPAKVAHWGKCPDGCVFYLGLVGADSYYEGK